MEFWTPDPPDELPRLADRKLTITVQRSVVDQIVGRVKTEASQRPLPMDPLIATLLTDWRSVFKVCALTGLCFCDGFESGGS